MIEVRDWLGETNVRRRLEVEARRGARPLVTVVIGLLLGLGIAGYMVAHISRTFFSSTRQVSFAIGDATGVVKGTVQVRLHGMPIGTVTDIKLRDQQAVVTAKVQKKYGDIYRDARAQLRPNTALQDMYIDVVDRGTKAAGVLEGSTPLALGRTSSPVNIDDVLDTFSAPVRTRLQTLLGQLGNGLDDRGARLRTAFAQFVPFVQDLGQIGHQLAVRGPLVARLVHNTAVLTDTLADSQKQLSTLIDSGSNTLTTLKDSSGDLGATLDALPPTMSTLSSSLAAVRGVLPDVNGAVRSLDPVADALPGALGDVRRLSDDAAPAVRALQGPVRQLVPLSASLRPLSHDLAATVDELAPQVPTVNKVTDDLVRCKQGIVGFFQWNASISKLGDSRAPYPRGNLVAGAQSSSVLNDPDELFPASCAPGRPIGGRVARPSDGS